MSLLPGTRLGSYEIVSALGAGGMGDVYRARDTNLNRDVAIKILPESFALDADRVARFKREAQVLASLNHPNIAQIYGIQGNALVMELVDGEDLSAHIARGALPLADALAIARQIADALEAAHEQGIIHRDLKPQNIKVRADGTVKVLDFGLAKAIDSTASRTLDPGPLAPGPTMTSPAMTAMGMILGTAAYMAPEQARGKAVDRRADIWAFGVVLYEMLSGRRAFGGDDISITLANVLKDDVKLDLLPADLPAALCRLLRRCLEKDPRKRLSSIGDARLEIDDAIAGTREASQRAPVASGRWSGWARLSIGLALVSVALATWLAVNIFRRSSSDISQPAIARFSLVSDPNLRVNTWVTTPFAVSRDGQTVVFSGDVCNGTFLWVRTLADAEPRVLADTAGAYNPAISPDGEWVAFVVANHQIKKIRLDGTGLTTVLTIDDATAALAWTSDDEIIFEKIGSNSGLHRVSANGGATPELLIPLDVQANERSQRRPLVLLDERRVLYQSGTSDGRSATIAAFSLDDGRRVRLGIEGTQPLGVVDGQLVYARNDGALMAAPFDARGMRVLGLSRQLVDQVAVSGFGTPVTLSPGGTLVAAPPSPQLAQLLLSDLAGKTTSSIGSARDFGSALFSPDGRRIAVSIGDDLWFVDPVSGELTRLTREKGGSLTDWTKDSTSLVFTRKSELWITPVDGSAGPRKLGPVEGTVLGASMLPDRQSVVVARRMNGAEGEVDREELVRVPLDGGGEVTTIIASRSSGATMRFGEVRVSPNGKWVAFQERNGQQIHVHALDGPSAVQVSDTGGNFPVWSADSRRIFYQASTGAMVADLEMGTPLGVRRQSIPALSCSGRVTDASSDGHTLLVRAATDRSSKVMVTLNWAAQLRRQLGK